MPSEPIRIGSTFGKAVAPRSRQKAGSRSTFAVSNRPVRDVVLGAYAACNLRVSGHVRSRAEFLQSSVTDRPDVWLPLIKAACHQLRKFSLEGGELDRSNILVSKYQFNRVDRARAFQLSLISRALPAATKKKCESTLADFIKTATVPSHHSFDPPVRFEALASYLKDGISGSFEDEEPGFPGSSSSYDFTRSQGGQAAAFVAALDPLTSERLKDTCSRQVSSFDRRLAKMLTRQSLEKFSSQETVNVMRIIPLAERGYKSRIVTCSQPSLVSRAHKARRFLWRIILRTPQISRHLGSPQSRIRVGPRGWIVSTDMNKATDEISHSSLAWFCLQFNIPPDLVYEGFFVDTGKEVLPYVRGCPMGMPCSWAILSLFHYMCFRAAGVNRFAIRGDDAIARLTHREWGRYRSLLKLIGFSLNLEKTFRSPDAGTFCEKCYHLKGEYLCLQPSFPLRILNPEDKTLAIRDIALTAKESMVDSFVVRRIFTHGMPSIFALAKKYGVPLFLPSFYGGLGFPPSRKTMTTQKQSDKIRWADTHGLSMPVQVTVTGNNMKKAVSKLSGLRYTSSANETCVHIERLISEVVQPASLLDILDGSRKEVKTSLHRFLKLLSRRYSEIPRARGSYRQRCSTLFDRQVLVSRASVKSTLKHVCMDNERPKESFGRSFFLNF